MTPAWAPGGDGNAALMAWGERARRDLPWRRTRDPWAVLVSEAMLQQTQVARVAGRYEAFLARLPTVAACAGAPPAEVIRLWAGLGYNRRAVVLQRAAQACVDRHGGRVPSTLADLVALPGVGPYTARAVLAFAFEADHGVVDTNAARVLARLGGSRLTAVHAQARADALVPPGRAWAWNQAVLDLGATVCVKTAPRCDRCPVAAWCGWRRAGGGPDPAVGTAGVPAPQSAFAGSDRQGRGRLLDALRAGPVPVEGLEGVMGWSGDPDRARRVAATLVADGLAVPEGGAYRLP